MRFGGQLPRSVEAVDAHVGELAMALVRALRLAECLLLTCHVEDVVDDLEKDTQLRSEPAEGDCGRSSDATQDGYAVDRRGDQPAGLELVQAADVVRFALDVHVLAADHPVDARSGDEPPQRG